jgi:hypothetical protein
MDRLAEELRVPPEELRAWLDGSRETPVEAFVRALDIVAKGALHPQAEQPPQAARSESPDVLGELAALEELLRALQVGGDDGRLDEALSRLRVALERSRRGES